MPKWRRAGGTAVTSSRATVIRPPSAVSKPASSRSMVVLPLPEGPSNARISPRAMSSVIGPTVTLSDQRLAMSCIWRNAVNACPRCRARADPTIASRPARSGPAGANRHRRPACDGARGGEVLRPAHDGDAVLDRDGAAFREDIADRHAAAAADQHVGQIPDRHEPFLAGNFFADQRGG